MFPNSVKDADFVPGREAEEETDDDAEEGDDDEDEDISDLNKSPLVKKVTKSVKSAMKAVPELHPADLKPNEGAIWTLCVCKFLNIISDYATF